MSDMMCVLEGLLKDRKLTEACNFYRENKAALPENVRPIVEQQLFKEDLEKSALIIQNKQNNHEYHIQRFHSLFKKEVK